MSIGKYDILNCVSTLHHHIACNCQAVVWQFSASGSFQAVVKQFSGNCQTGFGHLTGRCQAVFKQLSGNCQAVVRKLLGSCQAVARQLSGSCQVVITQSSGSSGCQTNIILVWNKRTPLNKRSPIFTLGNVHK